MIAHSSIRRAAAFTLVELLVTLGVFIIFMGGLLTSWKSLATTALNTTAYAVRQNDQMRVLDYVTRDIRRSATVALYNGATLVTDTTTWASELRLTIPDYYADTREEDNAIGTNTTVTPTFAAGVASYGAPLTVRYYTTGGAAIRNESGTLRTVGDAAGAFVFSFKRETSGANRCRVTFAMPRTGGATRQIETLVVPLSELRP